MASPPPCLPPNEPAPSRPFWLDFLRFAAALWLRATRSLHRAVRRALPLSRRSARALAAGAAFVCWVGTLVVSPLLDYHRLEVERASMTLPGWRHAETPTRVVLLADLHAREDEAEWVESVVSAARHLRPELVVLLGDYRAAIDASRSLSPEAMAELLAPLAEDCPVLYVLGNHDEPWARRYDEAFRRRGFLPLEGATRRLTFANGNVADFRGASYVPNEKRQRLRQLFPSAKRGEEARVPVVAALHSCIGFLRYEALGADAVFGAHTHGGQVCLPGGWPLLVSAPWTPEEARAGLKTTPDGKPVYITRGIGMSRVPLRLYCPPELTLVELNGAEEKAEARERDAERGAEARAAASGK